jgi:hypothetical protein
VERLSEEHIRNRRRSTFYTGGILSGQSKEYDALYDFFKRNGQSVAKRNEIGSHDSHAW